LKFDLFSLCSDFGIEYKQSGNHHARQGWIQLCCPFCSDNSFHLGYNIEKGYFNCYRCGSLKIKKVLEELTKQPLHKLISKYSNPSKKEDKLSQDIRNSDFRCSLPPLTKDIGKPHILYLLSRKIDLKAVSVWNLMGIGNIGPYRNRIVAPIYSLEDDEGLELECWLTRDITNRSPYRYLNCPDKLAKTPLKQTIYGQWLYPTNHDIIIVEGIVDAWRLGAGAIALYGTAYTHQQINLLKKYRNKYIMLDMDEAGKKASEKLANDLSAYDGDVEIISYDKKDVAELSQHSAELIKKELLNKSCYE